ncbi:MAG: sigK [Clostridia bacterium]|nr:sigK [Clostridia bacterium]
MFDMALNVFFLILHVAGSGSFPKPLSSAQEQIYLIKMKEGDQSARAELIERNLRLVAHIVKKYYSATDEQDDLISIGTVGLIKAVDSFNSDKKTKLATYAAKCIENEILMHFRAQKKSSNDISINEEIDTDKDGNALSLMDVIAEEDNILDTICNKIRVEQLMKAISEVLDDREKVIINLRYGLTEPAMTQKETAKRLGISRSYVSRLEKRALQALRDYIKY